MTKPAERCAGSAQIGGPGPFSQCRFKGTLEHEGKRYCRIHHPPTVKSKNDEKHRKWQAEWAAKDAARAKADDIRKAEQRVLAIADVLQGENKAGHDVLVSAGLDVLSSAVADLKELGWESKL